MCDPSPSLLTRSVEEVLARPCAWLPTFPNDPHGFSTHSCRGTGMRPGDLADRNRRVSRYE
ncbi:hypothetical protein ALP91_03889 [Pseudomonas savastanoi pv. glycinea]|nr:hypothetical protein ALP91_03889 [Pseudomonas savastanoi pv. glycinea]